MVMDGRGEGEGMKGREGGKIRYLVVFVLMVFSNSSFSISGKGLCAPLMPALAKNMSRRPYLDMASSTTPLTDGSSLASKHRAWTSTEG